MSSAAVEQRYFAQEAWLGPSYRNQSEQRHLPSRPERELYGSQYFTGGLPTPPATKRMNVVSSAVAPSRGNFSGCAGSVNSYPDPYYTQTPQHATYTSQNHTQPSHQPKMNGFAGISMPVEDRAQEDEIASHLQIPASVNKSKGSLSEFCTEIASLFWFESAETLDYAEGLAVEDPTDRGLVADAVPSIGFRKWVTTILSTTQVGKNVILLGLLFIYRLKQFNPGVSGKRGSEFRLLTIALMLGNKFLDDNTYTNKTWAEVSGISVTEIHIMEVEFLSNMRYDLYVSAEEWLEWKAKLGRLGAFYEKAKRFGSRMTPVPVTPTIPPSPRSLLLPSPPSNHSAKTSVSIPGRTYATLPNPGLNAPQLQTSPSRGHRFGSEDILNSRKRSLDLGSDEPAAKRHQQASSQYAPRPEQLLQAYPPINAGPVSGRPMAHVRNMPSSNSVLPRLPMPRLPLSLNTLPENHLAPLQLPGTRALANVYPPSTTSSWSNPVTPIGQPDLFQHPMPSLGDFSRNHSNAGSVRTSPNGYANVTPVHQGLSPSYFLTNRQSPYRPVRYVNTLLHPPPTTALQNHTRNFGHDQMHYQPLSKIDFETRTGRVPYQQVEGYHQSNANTPLTQKYPYHP